MSIFLKAVQRINPSEPDEPKKWYPVQYTKPMGRLTRFRESGNSRKRVGQLGKVSWRGLILERKLNKFIRYG